ncbi:retrotransposon protein, putative, ty1-copia subclass, partial [Tanacetum coccineum]
SSFEREKLSGSNFNDWFHSPKIVLRVDKKQSIIEQPIPLAPPADSKYLHSGMQFMILIMRLLVSGSENYNMHNMGKTIGELHALLIEYEKGLPKKTTTPQGKDKSYIPKPKNLKPYAKENPTKDDACHHCKEVGHYKRNCPAYLAELIKKKKQVGTANSSDREGEYISQEFKDYLKACENVQKLTPPYTPQHNGDCALETATRILHMVLTKKFDKTPYELWYEKVPNLSYLKVWGCEALVKRDMPDKLQQRSVKRIFIGKPKENMGYYFYFPPENKIVVARYTEFLEKNLLSQEVSGRAEELEKIQDKDTSPSENTIEIPMEVEGFEPPQEEFVPVRRSARTHRAPDHLCLNVEVDEHSLGDLNESNNYKAAILDPESDKWVNAMNAEMQSIKDNQVWCLVDLPPNCKTVGSKWFLKKKTNMDGIVHTYKARLVSKDIVAFYDYKIWQMDVKTAFLNGYLNEDIYMVQPEGFADPNHPRKVKRMQNVPYASVVGSIIGAVDWKSSKQSTTAMSATEAEYIVASEAAMEAV